MKAIGGRLSLYISIHMLVMLICFPPLNMGFPSLLLNYEILHFTKILNGASASDFDYSACVGN